MIDALPEALWTVITAISIVGGVAIMWRTTVRLIRENRAIRAATAEYNRHRCDRRWECEEHVCPRECERRIVVAS